MRASHRVCKPAAVDRQPMARIAQLQSRFCRDESGTTAVIYGLMFSVVLLAAGMSIDYSRSTAEQARMQWALDSSVLAASSKLGAPDQDVAGTAVAKKFMMANMREGSKATIDSVTFSAADGSVSANANSVVPMTIMEIFGYDKFDVKAHSSVVRGNATIEVAMVLDNSGSMGGSMTSLKDAAKSMTGILFAGADGTDKVKVALVPFAASVKVGSSYLNSGWIDTGAASSIHSENFNVSTQPVVYSESHNVNKTRVELLSDLNIGWAGCVESRPGLLDTNDDPPLSAIGNSLFVPMFAPDEPDDYNAEAAGYNRDSNNRYYLNNYISDYGGTCPQPAKVCIRWNSRKTVCREYEPPPPLPVLPVTTAQSRTCKYEGATVDTSSGKGPNYMCTSKPIMALSNNKIDVDVAITALTAGGNTNIGEGVMWGWRALSPDLPFTDGRSFSDRENKKIMIVMTDGDNTYNTDNGRHSKSLYGASGFAARGRLGTTYSNSAYTQVMDTKLATACTNAKAAGITVYTVAFGTGVSTTTQALLTQCASSPSGYFVAANATALVASFQNIGKEIADLRVAY
jgi:Flp pilus assembly protein TadG